MSDTTKLAAIVIGIIFFIWLFSPNYTGSTSTITYCQSTSTLTSTAITAGPFGRNITTTLTTSSGINCYSTVTTTFTRTTSTISTTTSGAVGCAPGYTSACYLAFNLQATGPSGQNTYVVALVDRSNVSYSGPVYETECTAQGGSAGTGPCNPDLTNYNLGTFTISPGQIATINYGAGYGACPQYSQVTLNFGSPSGTPQTSFINNYAPNLQNCFGGGPARH